MRRAEELRSEIQQRIMLLTVLEKWLNEDTVCTHSDYKLSHSGKWLPWMFYMVVNTVSTPSQGLFPWSHHSFRENAIALASLHH